MTWKAGVCRRVITPQWGVELAGLGYYLQRTWERVIDNLTATALVVSDERSNSVAIVAADLMYNEIGFTCQIRRLVAAHTDIPGHAVCVNFSHSHNAPTAGLIRGGGTANPEYLQFAAHQIATAVIVAWRNRKAARLYSGFGELAGMTYNRTRENGPVDTRVSVLRADAESGSPLAVMVNFHAHPTVHMEVDLRAVTRDWPGEVVDQIEAAMPGVTALYLQGTCGDVNFRRDLTATAERYEVARAVTGVSLHTAATARPIEASGVSAVTSTVSLPTRRWMSEEVMRDREEGLYRLKTGDTTGWLDGFARNIVNEPRRLPERYAGSIERTVAATARFAVEWTDEILPQLDTRSEVLATEVQGLRIGDVYFAAHPSELFTSLGLDLRARWPSKDLFVLGYSNGSIGYMPDAHEIEHSTYAAVQSPKFSGQFPFTRDSGRVFVEGLLNTLQRTQELSDPSRGSGDATSASVSSK